jgi:hypothetical protein
VTDDQAIRVASVTTSNHSRRTYNLMLSDNVPTISLTLPPREQRAQTCRYVESLPSSQSSLSWHHISSHDSREPMDHVLTLSDPSFSF